MLGYLFERSGLYDTTHDGRELVNSKRFAFLLYIGLTIMLFAGLFGGYLVLRGNTEVWPPLGAPPMTLIKILPSWLLLIGTVVIMLVARKALKQNILDRFRLFTMIGLLTSILFLFAFGIEWWRLMAGGVRLNNVFGGMFYIVTGCFIVHFIGGSYGLVSFLRRAKSVPFSLGLSVGFNNTLTFYYLMVALWTIIGGLVYYN